MNLKALAEQRLAALGDQQLGVVRWASRPVPVGLDADPSLEQALVACTSRDIHRKLARFLGLSTARNLAGVLDDLAWGRCLVEVDPGPGGGPILLASDDAAIDPGERRVVYRATELREALGLPVTVLRELHRMKSTFGGTLKAS